MVYDVADATLELELGARDDEAEVEANAEANSEANAEEVYGKCY